jgi:hypothetical protein
MIASAGSAGVIAQTPDGKLYSDQVMLNVQAPPRPTFQYVGMISRARHNNDTGYFMEQGKQTPTGARLNDVVGGRFRLVSISRDESVFEDVNLGFKYRVKLYNPPPGTTAGSGSAPPNSSFPGFPPNIRAVPIQPNGQRPQPQKKDDEDDDDGNP